MYFKSEPGRGQLGSYYQLKINYLVPFFVQCILFLTACSYRIVFYGELHDFLRKKKKSTVDH